MGLYEFDTGEVIFFDVMDRPRKQGLPAEDLSLDFPDVIARIEAIYDARNNAVFEWDESESQLRVARNPRDSGGPALE